MTNNYFDLISQTFDFPQEEFYVKNDLLFFHDLDIYRLIRKYGTPLRITYLPAISRQISRARGWFQNAIKQIDYTGNYTYCYCTKSSHFSFVLDEVLKNNVQLEISSAFDIDIIEKLYLSKKIDKTKTIICNGYKPSDYIQRIAKLINLGFQNVIPVLDNIDELDNYEATVVQPFELGIRIAADEQPGFAFYTSRLGIRIDDIIRFYQQRLMGKEEYNLKMLHFFINSGVNDEIYYWDQLVKAITVYIELKKICPTLTVLNIGGGFPAKNSLGFEYDYDYMVLEILTKIKDLCDNERVPCPDIYTEFGKYTVGESGAFIFKVLGSKLQNDKELWYMIDNSLMTTMPDTWSLKEKFILLPVNKWSNKYHRVNIGGLSCDQSDYYNFEVHQNEVYMPVQDKLAPLYIGFFNVGAYQEALSGYGGIKHCLIPSPTHIVVGKNEEGKLDIKTFAPPQQAQSMLDILGY